MSRQLIISCEHASAAIPEPYKYLFVGHEAILTTHAAYDIGADRIYTDLLKQYDVPHCKGQYSRLLIDLNRTLDNPSCYSKFTKKLPPEQKLRIEQDIYRPYFNQLQGLIQQNINQKQQVLHISVHSFTPVLNNIVRKADIGLLYDPSRLTEVEFTNCLKQAFVNTPYKVYKNAPYRGTTNGLTTYFRKLFSAECYIGIELELNQKLMTPEKQKPLSKAVCQAFQVVI